MLLTVDSVFYIVQLAMYFTTDLPDYFYWGLADEEGRHGEGGNIYFTTRGEIDTTRGDPNAEANLAVCQELYALHGNAWPGFNGGTVQLRFRHWRHGDISTLDTYGSYNPLIPESWQAFKDRVQAASAGSPSSGISVDFDDLPVIDGVRQVTSAKWVDTVHHHGERHDTLQIADPADYVHREGTHRNIFVHNASHAANLDIIDHLGEPVEILPPEHSCDIRVTREKPPGRNSLIVLRPASHHLDLTGVRTPERRWQQVVSWAKKGIAAVTDHPQSDPKAHLSAIQQTYQAYLYNVTWVAHNRVNRTNDLHWTNLENALIDWQTFVRNADGAAMQRRIAVDAALSQLYRADRKWAWNADDGDIEQISPSDLSAAPDDALDASLMAVRNVLGYVQDAGISDASLSEVTAVQFDGSEATAIIANPTTYNLIVSNTTINPEITVTPTYEHATVELTAPDTLNADGSLPTGVHTWAVVITSQDGTDTNEYVLNVTRRP